MRKALHPYRLPENGPAYLPRHDHWVFRRGMYALAMLFVVVILVAGLVPYPTQLTATVSLRTDHPIAHVNTRIGGEIEEVRVKVGDSVKKGQVLAVIKSQTPYGTIQELKEILHSPEKSSTAFVLNGDGPMNPGKPMALVLQGAYQRYVQAKQKFGQLAQYSEKELSKDKWQWVLRQAQQSAKEQELRVQQAETEQLWSKKQLTRHRSLYEKGVIATLELESMEKSYIQKRQQWEQAQWDLARKRSELQQLKVEGELGSNALDRERDNIEMEWAMAREELAAQISDWEENHLLTSPVSGRLVHSEVWGAHQNLKAGGRIFSIEPLEIPNWFAQCQVPLHNAGQLRIGQSVLIDLEHWPKNEFGALRGELVSISGVPYEGHYSADARLYSTWTTYGKRIQLAPELSGTAEIIIESHSLLGSLFQSLFHEMVPFQNPTYDDE